MNLSRGLQLGEISIQLVHEKTAPYVDPLKFFPALTRERLEENRAWLEPHALDAASGHLILSFHSYLVRTPHHNVLIDTCVGNHKQRRRVDDHMQASEAYMRNLDATGLRVEDIDFVLCSHLHYDHVGWNTRLENGRWVPTFPKARYVFSKREYDYWVGEHRRKPIDSMTDSVLPVVEAGRADLVTNEHVVCEHVELQPTPGHTIDHVAVRVASRSEVALFTGDLTHSPLQLRYPELGTRADHDSALGSATRRRFFEQSLDSAALVCTMHFPAPSTAGRLERWGEGFRFKG
jgi:glyoxylase-like metal-dependent hydrolase (beta-lactamase superfamily II)